MYIYLERNKAGLVFVEGVKDVFDFLELLLVQLKTLILRTHPANQTQRHTDIQTHRHTDTQTYRHTDAQTLRHTDTQTHRHRQTDRQTDRHQLCLSDITHTHTHTHLGKSSTHTHTHTHTHGGDNELRIYGFSLARGLGGRV